MLVWSHTRASLGICFVASVIHCQAQISTAWDDIARCLQGCAPFSNGPNISICVESAMLHSTDYAPCCLNFCNNQAPLVNCIDQKCPSLDGDGEQLLSSCGCPQPTTLSTALSRTTAPSAFPSITTTPPGTHTTAQTLGSASTRTPSNSQAAATVESSGTPYDDHKSDITSQAWASGLSSANAAMTTLSQCSRVACVGIGHTDSAGEPQAARVTSDGSRGDTSLPGRFSQPIPVPTGSDSSPAQHRPRLPIPAIASAVGGGVLFLALLVTSFLCVRRLGRSSVGRKHRRTPRDDNGARTLSSRVPSYMKPGSPWEAPIEWEVTHTLPKVDLVSSRAATPSPYGTSSGSFTQDRALPVIHHDIPPSSLIGSTVHSSVTGERGRHSDGILPALLANERFTAANHTARATRESWESDKDTLVSDEGSITEICSAEWNPSRMVRPPLGKDIARPAREADIRSSELARRRDSLSEYTYESGETGMAL